MDPMLGMIFSVPWNWAPLNYQLCQGQVLPLNQYEALYSLMGTVFGGNGSTSFGLPNLQGRAPIGTGILNAAHFTLGNTGGAMTTTLALQHMPAHIHTAGAAYGSVASGPVTLPVNGTVSGITIGTTSTLTATTSGSLTIAAAAPATASSNQPVAGAVLAKAAAGAPNIYNTTTSAANIAIGPAQTFTGPVAGTIDATASGGTVAGSASGTVTLPVTGAGVTIGVSGGSQPFVTMPPYLAMSFIIAVNGLYPDRP